MEKKPKNLSDKEINELEATVWIGKNGLTPEFIEQLKTASKNVENIRISILKSSGRDRQEVKEMKERILQELGVKFTAKIIGFTIILKKWRKAR